MIVSRARVSPAEQSLKSVLSSRAGPSLGVTARACRCGAICMSLSRSLSGLRG